MSPAVYSMSPGLGMMSSPPASSPNWPRGSPGSVFDNVEAFPDSASSSAVVPQTPGGTIVARRTPGATPNSVAPRKRLAPEEINAKWREIFGKMETWTSEDVELQTPTAASTVKGSAATSAATYRVTSYASAAAAQALYATELARYEQQAEGYAFRAQQHAQLVLRAQHQQRNGVKNGERRIILAALEPPPSAPQLPQLTPFTPSIAAVDAEWRAELRREPEKLRGDAMDHKALEGRLMDFLHRESHPLTLVKESFVSNFLEAYSVAKNPALRACTTNQASDLLLSNTLPTLLYFLDLLTKLLMKLFPELDATRNPETLESIRQSAMESIFPSIFPTLFALYKRKYFFRDAELSSKMSVLSSVGQGGCNLTLLDLGVSKYFCLDETVVMEERVKMREKRRARERKRRREEEGETEAEAALREMEEDRVREQKEAAALKKIQEERKKATRARREEEQLGLVPDSAADGPISQLTHAFDQAALDAAVGAGENSADSERGMRTPPRKVVASQTTLSPVTSPSHHTRSSSSSATPTLLRSPSGSNGRIHGRPVSAGSPGSPAMPILPPVTRLSPVTGFDSGSLSRSPRAERIQDVMLSRSPSHRIAGSLATAPLGSPSNISKSQRKIGLVPTTIVSSNSSLSTEDDLSSTSSAQLLDHSPARSKSMRMLSASQIAAATAALRNGGESIADGAGVSSAVPTDAAHSLLPHTSPKTSASSSAEAAKKQVGFFSPGVTEATPENTSPTVQANISEEVSISPTAMNSTVSQPSSLGLALQQRRGPIFTGAAGASSAAHANSHSVNTARSGPSTPPRVYREDKATISAGGRALGLGLSGKNGAGLVESDEDEADDLPNSKRHPWQGDRDDDSSNDNSPRLPSMTNSTGGNGGFPALGSSMPMLQGLPSSMLTHTPGSGSELLKKEIARQREGKRFRKGGENDVQGSPQLLSSDSGSSSHHSTVISPANHLSAQQPFILNSSPGGLNLTAASNPSLTNGAIGLERRDGEDGARAELNDEDEEDDNPAFPYQEAVILLRRLTSERTPRDKLQCLIAVSQEVVSSRNCGCLLSCVICRADRCLSITFSVLVRGSFLLPSDLPCDRFSSEARRALHQCRRSSLDRLLHSVEVPTSECHQRGGVHR